MASISSLTSFLLHDGVVFVDILIESEAVLEARAAAAGDKHTQLQVRVLLVDDQVAHPVGGGVGEAGIGARARVIAFMNYFLAGAAR